MEPTSSFAFFAFLVSLTFWHQYLVTSVDAVVKVVVHGVAAIAMALAVVCLTGRCRPVVAFVAAVIVDGFSGLVV